MKLTFFTGKLSFSSALHVGSGNDNEFTDAVFRRNGAGQPVIPGTSLAGALRAIAVRIAPWIKGDPCKDIDIERKQADGYCRCLTCQLFGDCGQEKQDDTRKDKEAAKEKETLASKLWIYDAKPEQEAELAIRDFVGIGRTNGAAQDGAKFDAETVKAQTVFAFMIKAEALSDKEEKLLAAVLAEWQKGRGRLGGRSVRGMGAFVLDSLVVREWDLTQGAVLLEYLGEDKPWLKGGQEVSGWVDDKLPADCEIRPSADLVSTLPLSRNFLTVDLTLAFDGPMLTMDSMAAARFDFDHAPLLTKLDKSGKPVLPGSALRGVLRSQAERIVRTMWMKEGDFESVCPACDSLYKKNGITTTACDSRLPDNDPLTLWQRERKTNQQELCLTCRLFGSTLRGSRFTVEDGEFLHSLVERDEGKVEENKPIYKVCDFLAIDRFTGGGKNGAKFDALALWSPVFRITLRLDNPADWEIGLLAFVLRDLQDGMMTVGFGGSKGFGWCDKEHTKIKLIAGWLGAEKPLVDWSKWEKKGGRSGIYQVDEADLRFPDAELNQYADALQHEMQNFAKNHNKPGKIEDLYFHNDALRKNYPLSWEVSLNGK